MNLILLEPQDFFSENRVRFRDRRLKHILHVHKAEPGDELRVGIINGKIGSGFVERIDEDGLEMSVSFHTDPPPPLPIRLILALPRPKVLNRAVAAAVSMGIRHIDVINAWRVEKSYWESPRLSEENLRLQSIMGLEQAGDTALPTIRLHKLFAPFVREELPRELEGTLPLLAHPAGRNPAPRNVARPIVLAIGPEGGFIEREAETFRGIGFDDVSLGPRILRVETALAYLIGRLL